MLNRVHSFAGITGKTLPKVEVLNPKTCGLVSGKSMDA